MAIENYFGTFECRLKMQHGLDPEISPLSQVVDALYRTQGEAPCMGDFLTYAPDTVKMLEDLAVTHILCPYAESQSLINSFMPYVVNTWMDTHGQSMELHCGHEVQCWETHVMMCYMRDPFVVLMRQDDLLFLQKWRLV